MKDEEFAVMDTERKAKEREWATEKERACQCRRMRVWRVIKRRLAGAYDLVDVKPLLPTMSNDDVLSFFMSMKELRC